MKQVVLGRETNHNRLNLTKQTDVCRDGEGGWVMNIGEGMWYGEFCEMCNTDESQTCTLGANNTLYVNLKKFHLCFMQSGGGWAHIETQIVIVPPRPIGPIRVSLGLKCKWQEDKVLSLGEWLVLLDGIPELAMAIFLDTWRVWPEKKAAIWRRVNMRHGQREKCLAVFQSLVLDSEILVLQLFFWFFKKIFFIYLTEITSREREEEAGSLQSREPDVGLDPRTLGSWPELKAEA